jgi:hypothetical protein
MGSWRLDMSTYGATAKLPEPPPPPPPPPPEDAVVATTEFDVEDSPTLL